MLGSTESRRSRVWGVRVKRGKAEFRSLNSKGTQTGS